MMAYQVKKEEMYLIVDLFSECEDSLVQTCIEGLKGTAWVDRIDNPQTGIIVVADFGFTAGKGSADFIQSIPEEIFGEFKVIVTSSPQWEEAVEQSFPKTHAKKTRYGIKKEGDVFDRKQLEMYANSLDREYELRDIDQELFHLSRSLDWAASWTENYLDYNEYDKYGVGVVAVHHGEIVAGASAYTYYSSGIEIEIDTREDYRRKGLALACGAKLILRCLESNRYPNWDAQNIMSLGAAEKLGYHFQGEYTAYEIWSDGKRV